MQNKTEIKNRIEKLRKMIEQYRYEIHVLNIENISESALDQLKKELKDLENDNPEFFDINSPTNRVAGVALSKFNKIKHKIRQWSFDDAFDENDIIEFNKKVNRYLKLDLDKQNEYICELKIDGLKIVLDYKNGILQNAATRGDGVIGEDVTHNIRTIESIPLKLDYDIDIIVEGEVFINKNNFERINNIQKEKGQDLYANPRNIAAGTIRQLDPSIAAERKLDMFVYDISYLDIKKSNIDKNIYRTKTQEEELLLLKKLGFKVNDHYIKVKNTDDIIKFWKKWQDKFKDEQYLIDGIVLKINSQELQDKLGYTGKTPRFGIAFKFKTEQVVTTVLGIDLQVGRTGVITPVAILKPVEVLDTIVSRATLHNEDEIKRLDIRIGDTVILQKSGDVIPDIIKVIKELRPENTKEFIFPKKVAGCGGDQSIIRKEGESAYRCIIMDSDIINKQKFYHFVSKKCMNIEGLGPKQIDLFWENDLLKDFSSIYELDINMIKNLPRMGEKSAQNIIDSIYKSQNIDLYRFLSALSISNIGEETARDLSITFKNDINAIINAKLDDFKNINGIGDTVASNIYEWFKEEKNIILINKLLKYIKFNNLTNNTNTNHSFYNKTFVITGSLENMSRAEAENIIRNKGGNISSSVSKKTDYLLKGEDAGSKLDKAIEHNVKILNKEEFLSLL